MNKVKKGGYYIFDLNGMHEISEVYFVDRNTDFNLEVHKIVMRKQINILNK